MITEILSLLRVIAVYCREYTPTRFGDSLFENIRLGRDHLMLTLAYINLTRPFLSPPHLSFLLITASSSSSESSIVCSGAARHVSTYLEPCLDSSILALWMRFEDLWLARDPMDTFRTSPWPWTSWKSLTEFGCYFQMDLVFANPGLSGGGLVFVLVQGHLVSTRVEHEGQEVLSENCKLDIELSMKIIAIL